MKALRYLRSSDWQRSLAYAAWLVPLAVSGCAGTPVEQGEVGAVSQDLAFRSNSNSTHENVVFQDSNVLSPVRQTFLNNLQNLTSVYVKLGGNQPNGENVTVKIYDGCGNLKTQVTQLTGTRELTTPTSWKWVEVPLNNLPVEYGKYYVMEVYVNQLTKLVLNTNRYEWGRAIRMSAPVAFPEKKQDLMFMLQGTVADSMPFWPQATTNIACPSRCFLANSSGTENTQWDPKNHFNVVMRSKPNDGSEKGSFWSEYNTPDANANGIPDGIDALKVDFKNMLEGTSTSPGLRETYPFNSYYVDNNSPPYNAMYYPNMNFYIAVEDPNADPLFLRGLSYCANIDAIIDAVIPTPTFGYGGEVGRFRGEVGRTAAPGWGASMRFTMVHEVFGHGFSGLTDEYTYTGGGGPVSLASTWQPNMLSIDSGCNEWCSGTQNVEWLKSQMVQDKDYACWSQTTSAGCQAPGGNAKCRWIGDLSPIAYWGSYKCIPNDVSLYNIGINCAAKGNQKCFPLAPVGTSGGAYMNTVQPSGLIMQSFHENPGAPGFSNAVENVIKDELDCGFSVAPCGAAPARCSALLDRWATPGNGYETFLQFANSCEGTYIRRR